MSVPVRQPSTTTVLVVDDQEIVRHVMTRGLTDAGFRVLVAEDGMEAWDILQEAREPVDVVVTDIVMPRMGGIELAAKVATMPDPPRVVFVSGYGRGRISLDQPFLTKPFDPDELTSLVNQVLGIDLR
jgi:two-component system cell cycle sensor histidine kinase/response regulator CckA